MLCYSERQWRRFLNPGSNLNRLRAGDYQRLFSQGFNQVKVEILYSDLPAFRAARPRIRPEFLSGNDEQDAATHIMLRAGRPLPAESLSPAATTSREGSRERASGADQTDPASGTRSASPFTPATEPCTQPSTAGISWRRTGPSSTTGNRERTFRPRSCCASSQVVTTGGPTATTTAPRPGWSWRPNTAGTERR